ncbi:MAG TPA: sigma-70 family RNA polymerase sigma factor [Nocardioides sp.]|nr:sigma-70 family RNA polymerase sigma factor [Nocardioides sp.]
MTVATGFEEQLAPYRGELLAHCYRMLGSAHDAEDLVQETYLRAWRAREQYDAGRSSIRTWLYRIATNACLTALESRGRRPLPSGLVAASDPRAPLVHGGEVPWLQPFPDAWLDGEDPAGMIVRRSSVRLAFAAALQGLSARERAALVLRDVVGFSAEETADAVGTTVPAVNSALQRARGRLRGIEDRTESAREPSAGEQRAWVDRYTAAFERADVEGLVRLLADDVVMEMPPMVNWFAGTDAYAVFMRWVYAVGGADWRTVPVGSNGQPAFAAYRHDGDGYALHTLQVLTVTGDRISRTSVFQDTEVFACFGLAARL